MKVIMRAAISGTRDGATWPPVGGEIDVPDAEAADLITACLAVAAGVERGTPEEPPDEAATLAPLPERAASPKTVTRAKLRGGK